jgi:protocatechuate 3,4-dioxygenase beta subunit
MDEKPIRTGRRDVLHVALGGLGGLLMLRCGAAVGAAGGSPAAADAGTTDDGSASGEATSTADADAANEGAIAECREIPDETGGPYPDVDGMISDPTYERSDITEGRAGTPLTLTLQVLDVASACAPVVGARVIIWHCDANGVYSEYDSAMNSDPAENDIGSTSTTYLRGWQTTDATGSVTFTTIYPGWYTPRVTHIHIMIYDPSDLTTPVKTTQFAFPDATNAAVYAQTTLYPKGPNTTTNATDMVFAGSVEGLLATVTGDATSGYTATLPVGLASY